jgi:hypothetical protein
MKVHPLSIRRPLLSLLCVAALVSSGAAFADKNKPSVSLRASPSMGFAPTRVVLTAELRGGADDYQDFYCASTEWDWGDGTKSVNKVDCDPFEAGKSAIERRHVVTHVFEMGGDFQVEFRLKQKDKTVASARTSVKIRPGLRDGGDGGQQEK